MKKFYFLTLALVLGALSMNAKTIYFNTGVWNKDGAYFQAWNWSNNSDGEWCSFTHVEGNLFKTEIADNKTNIIFVRKAASSNANDWNKETIWGQTADLKIEGDNNQYNVINWDNEGYWSVYSVYPETICMVGYNDSWEPANPLEISGEEGVYTAEGVEFTSVTFKLSTVKGVWDVFNCSGLNVGTVTVGTPATITKGISEDNTIAVGTYNITIDLVNNTFLAIVPTPTAIETVGADAAAAVYYNLQGMKVANPENGIFVKVQGGKAVKVVL